MRSLVQVNGCGLRLTLCMFLAGSLGACAQLKSGSSQMPPPTQASPEQSAERERESQPPKDVQARPNGRNP